MGASSTSNIISVGGTASNPRYFWRSGQDQIADRRSFRTPPISKVPRFSFRFWQTFCISCAQKGKAPPPLFTGNGRTGVGVNGPPPVRTLKRISLRINALFACHFPRFDPPEKSSCFSMPRSSFPLQNGEFFTDVSTRWRILARATNIFLIIMRLIFERRAGRRRSGEDACTRTANGCGSTSSSSGFSAIPTKRASETAPWRKMVLVVSRTSMTRRSIHCSKWVLPTSG